MHLKRTGSASPFARALSQILGITAANHALDVEAMGRLFATDLDQEEEYVNAVLQQDSFLSGAGGHDTTVKSQVPGARDDVCLHRLVQHNAKLRSILSERAVALNEQRLLTISFRTVEEYLACLELASRALNDCQSLVAFFLAAAVSDFYVPRQDRSQHKIQSTEQGYTLELKAVPKMIKMLRDRWAPQAFVVSFKLETDAGMLRRKSEQAVARYGCHLVIGNLLQSRHDVVWMLQPPNQREMIPSNASQWESVELLKPVSDDPDALESILVDAVVQAHFEFISWHFQADGSGVKAALEAQKRLEAKKRGLHRAAMWKNAQGLVVEAAGIALALFLSYAINTALHRRLRGS